MSGNKLPLTLVPGREQLGGRRRANQTRVRDAGEANTGDVAGRRVDALDVPDSLGGPALELSSWR